MEATNGEPQVKGGLTPGSGVGCPHCHQRLVVKRNPSKGTPFAVCGNCGITILWNGYRSHEAYICDHCQGDCPDCGPVATVAAESDEGVPGGDGGEPLAADREAAITGHDGGDRQDGWSPRTTLVGLRRLPAAKQRPVATAGGGVPRRLPGRGSSGRGHPAPPPQLRGAHGLPALLAAAVTGGVCPPASCRTFPQTQLGRLAWGLDRAKREAILLEGVLEGCATASRR